MTSKITLAAGLLLMSGNMVAEKSPCCHPLPSCIDIPDHCHKPSCIDVPEWICAADTILNAIDCFADTLVDDSKIYDAWNTTLQDLYQEFDKRDNLRRQVFTCIRALVSDLQLALETCQHDAQAAASAAQLREQNLINQLSALRLETTAEIAYLNKILAEISNELASTRESYCAFVAFNEKRAHELIENLIEVRDNYELMVTKRTAFLDVLATFIERVRAFLYTSQVETEDLGQELCSASTPSPCTGNK